MGKTLIIFEKLVIKSTKPKFQRCFFSIFREALLDLINKETERQAIETREQLKHTEELEKLTDKIFFLEAK